MQTSKDLDLKITGEKDLGTDRPQDTIVEYGNNFLKLEKYLFNSASGLDSIKNGTHYDIGFKIWNSTPAIGDYVGWVNLMSGVYARTRKLNTAYKVGDLVTPLETNLMSYYKCTTAGTTSPHPANFLNTSETFYDVDNAKEWKPSFSWKKDEVIFATTGDKTYYMKCEKAGVSALGEPVWSKVNVNTTVNDGSVTWRKMQNIKWQRVGVSAQFRPFGKIE